MLQSFTFLGLVNLNHVFDLKTSDVRSNRARAVVPEHLLLDALVELVGSENLQASSFLRAVVIFLIHLLISQEFSGGTMDRAGLEAQVNAFRSASVIIGMRFSVFYCFKDIFSCKKGVTAQA